MNEILGTGFITITDLSDPIISSTEPPSPVEDMLWMDISVTPPVLKIFKNGVWVAVSDVGDALPSNIATGGYFSGDLKINKDQSGNASVGNIQILEGNFIHPNGGTFSIAGNKLIPTTLKNNNGGSRYIMFIGHDSSRFNISQSNASKSFIEADYSNKKWHFYTNDGTANEFELNDNDCIVAKIEEYPQNGSSIGIKRIVRYYENEDSVFEALTDGGRIQGIYKKDGMLFINAECIATGKLISANGVSEFDLDNGTFRLGGSGEHDFNLLFDGTDLRFANGAIKWENLDDNSKENLRNVTVNIEGGARSVIVNARNEIQTTPTVYTAKVMLGSQDITRSCTLQWTASGIYTGTSSGTTFLPGKGEYTNNESYVELVATYKGAAFKERIGIAVSKQGQDGQNGQDGQDGQDGVGIQSVTNYYLASDSSSGVTTSTSGWTETIQTVSSSKKYLWNYEKVTFTNGKTTLTTPCIIGNYAADGAPGATGAAGKGVKSITEYYLASASSSGVTTSTSGWTTTIQTISSSKKYLWNYEVTTYTDNSTISTSPCIIGTYGRDGIDGQNGATGTGVESITVQYYLSTSKTSQSGGSWVETPPTWSTGKYMWSRNKIVYKNPASTVYTTPVCDTSWEAVNEVKIGGKNLVINSNFKQDKTNWSDWGSPSVREFVTLNNKRWCHIKGSGTARYQGIQQNKFSSHKIMIEQATNYTFSARVKGGSSNQIFTVGIHWKNGDSSIIGQHWKDFNIGTSEQIITHTFTSSSGNEVNAFNIMLGVNSDTTVYDVYFTDVKLEKGNKATDWTPAPEDVDTAIGNAVKSVETRYYLSTSATTQTGGSWSTTMPAMSSGKFIWVKTVTTLVDGTVKETTPVLYQPDWVQDWSGTKTEIGGTSVLTPKLFAGTKNSDGTATGVAIGSNVFGTGANYSGIAGYKAGTKTFHLKTDGTMLIGPNTSGNHVSFDGNNLSIKASNISIGANSVTTTTDLSTAINKIDIGTRNMVLNSGFTKEKEGWSFGTNCSLDTEMTLDGNPSCKSSQSGLTSDAWRGCINYNMPSNPTTLKQGDVVTISCWYYVSNKSAFDSDITLECKGKLGDATSEIGIFSAKVTASNLVQGKWTKMSATATLTGTYNQCCIRAFVRRNGTAWFTNFKMEKGNKATDWTPAPEDIDDSLSETERVINENIDKAVSSAKEDVLASVGDSYTGKDEFKALTESVSSKFEQTSKDITATFETTQKYAKDIGGKLETFQDTVSTHIRFSSNGIDLGKTNSPFTATLDNTQLAFKENGQTVAYISNNKMHITQADIINTLRVGNSTSGFFSWIHGSNGNLSLKWTEK